MKKNNVVACVNCHEPVKVTALNAIRCEKCIKSEDFQRGYESGIRDRLDDILRLLGVEKLIDKAIEHHEECWHRD